MTRLERDTMDALRRRVAQLEAALRRFVDEADEVAREFGFSFISEAPGSSLDTARRALAPAAPVAPGRCAKCGGTGYQTAPCRECEQGQIETGDECPSCGGTGADGRGSR